MKILVTSGPTREPIDDVRFISNLSSGRTGRELANYFHDRGHEVLQLFGQGSAHSEKISRTIEFKSFSDLDSLLQKILREEGFDSIIHLAAVSDYSVRESFQGKIESDVEELILTLKRNFKIIDRIKSYVSQRYKGPLLVGFKLTSTAIKGDWVEAVRRVYSRGQVDLLVHNDLSDYSEILENHRFRIVDKDMNFLECRSVYDLCQKLEKILGEMK